MKDVRATDSIELLDRDMAAENIEGYWCLYDGQRSEVRDG